MSNNSPKDYGRWGKMGVKVVSKPTNKPTDKKKGGKKNG